MTILVLNSLLEIVVGVLVGVPVAQRLAILVSEQ
jgi:hypothetical protein